MGYFPLVIELQENYILSTLFNPKKEVQFISHSRRMGLSCEDFDEKVNGLAISDFAYCDDITDWMCST